MKYLISLVIIFIFFQVNLVAQAAVIDVSAIAAAIENGFTMYQTLQNAYATYEKTMQTYEHAKKMAEGIAEGNPGVLANAAYSLLEEEIQSKLSDLKSLYKEKTMVINGINFSIEDLYGTDVYSKILGSYQNMSDEDIKKLTSEEEQNYFAQNGIAPTNGLIIKNLGEQFSQTLMEGQARLTATESIPDLMNNYAKSVTDNSGLTSEIALAQQSSTLAANNLKVAVQSYQLTRDQLKLSQASFQLRQMDESNRNDSYNYAKSLDDMSYKADINEDSKYLGPTRSK